MMASQDLIAWVCSGIVLFGLLSYVVFEAIKRWRVNLRLSALDEGLLEYGGVSVEVITDAPPGSRLGSGVPADLIMDERL